MIVSYMRVSTKDQDVRRQRKAIEDYITKENIVLDKPIDTFTDKETGKHFDRDGYKKLKEYIRPGDIVIIKELDRLGRNKNLVKKELEWFKDNKITLRVLDIPTTLIDLTQFDDSMARNMMEMVNNILIEVYSTLAQQEYEKIEKRRQEGVAEMKRTGKTKSGKPTGRPKIELDKEQLELLKVNYPAWKEKKVTSTKFVELLGLKKDKFYRVIKQYEEESK